MIDAINVWLSFGAAIVIAAVLMLTIERSADE